ncbi:MAG: sulfatase-like hydrolase/transferase [Pseudomonadota bacterium]
MKKWIMAGALMLGLAACSAREEPGSQTTSDGERPNFVVIVADDLGWSDIGAFGGEIATPNLDALAERGTRMTNFYVAPTCSPTRAMLMTGLDHHAAGVGTMHNLARPNQNTRNYAAQLHEDVVTLAEALRASGYATMMSGKWHLAVDEDQRPHERGFEKSYALLPGGASHFGDMLELSPREIPVYVEDGEEVRVPKDFYSTTFYTDKMLEYLRASGEDEPFFAYLAYTAPHDPLQVPDEWSDRYAGKYDVGPVAIRKARLERQKELGLLGKDATNWPLSNFPPTVPLHITPWETRSEEQRAMETRPMEVYAAMVELLDEQIGRIIAELETSGKLDNTYIVFFSDNGASTTAPLIYPGSSKEWLSETWNAPRSEAGRPRSFTVMGREWAHVANTPFRLFKGQVAEGGTRSPFIVAGPGVKAGQTSDALAHVMDITPTLIGLAGVDPSTDALYEGRMQPTGASLAGVWSDPAATGRDGFATELFGNRAVREGQWKASFIARPLGIGDWQLFDLATDPGETRNVAPQNPEILKRLVSRYENYASENGVIPPVPGMQMSARQIFSGPCDEKCEQAFVEFVKRARAQAGKGSVPGPPPPPPAPANGN